MHILLWNMNYSHGMHRHLPVALRGDVQVVLAETHCLPPSLFARRPQSAVGLSARVHVVLSDVGGSEPG